LQGILIFSSWLFEWTLSAEIYTDVNQMPTAAVIDARSSFKSGNWRSQEDVSDYPGLSQVYTDEKRREFGC
jgi:hypothetical protein